MQKRTRLISLCVSPTPEGINRGNPSFIQARVWIFPWQQTQVEGMDTHSHLCSSSFSRESPHLSASSGVGLWKKDGTLAKLSSKSCFCCLLNISSGLKARLRAQHGCSQLPNRPPAKCFQRIKPRCVPGGAGPGSHLGTGTGRAAEGRGRLCTRQHRSSSAGRKPAAFRLAGRKSDPRRSVQAAVALGVSEQELEKFWVMRSCRKWDFSCPIQAAGEAARSKSREGSSPAAGASPEQSGFSNHPLAS